jgi:hypothetical protein
MIRYKLIIDFRSPKADTWWEVINDEVMGGRSESRLTLTPHKTAFFAGILSLEDYGGFASVRTHPADRFDDSRQTTRTFSAGDRVDKGLFRLLTRALSALSAVISLKALSALCSAFPLL